MRDRQGVRKREKGREEVGVADKRIVRKAKMRKIGTERERENDKMRETHKSGEPQRILNQKAKLSLVFVSYSNRRFFLIRKDKKPFFHFQSFYHSWVFQVIFHSANSC